MTEQQLLLFLLQVSVLFVAARVGGEVATRLRLPAHVGELVAGMLLGPSLLGWVWPGGFRTLFPGDALQQSLLEVLAWTGIIFLVLLAGLEVRLGVVRRSSRAVVGAWIGGFALPFAGGVALGIASPASLFPVGIERPIFALFLATAMSISAIPVIARILMDLNLYGTRVSMVILASAVADDTIGWVVLAVVAGLATGGVEIQAVVTTLLLTAGFLALAFTVGPRFVRGAMRFSARSLRVPFAQLSMMLTLVFAAGALTQAIGVHLVLGAFVVSILLGRLPRPDVEAQASVRQMGMAFFVPFFFAYTGLQVDLTALWGAALLFAVVAVLVASAGKIVGGGLGARLGGMPRWEAAAVGVGLNARGAMELVIAAIGLSIGVLNEASYAIIVLIAVFTTVMAGPMLKFCVERAARAAVPGEATTPAVRPAPSLAARSAQD